jgi:predicted DNA-binding antitoxin AbrB/MazE fold protein
MAIITAIFENGVFRPLGPVELPERTRVEFEPKVADSPVLPIALRETEITERDVETLLRVARDKNAGAGRYKRSPKKLTKSKQK